MGVSADGASLDVTDTATAYISLDQRSVTQPGHDLMLVWDERLDWYIAAETTPAETPVVMAYLNEEAPRHPRVGTVFVHERRPAPDGFGSSAT